jgi:hypothetical protein
VQYSNLHWHNSKRGHAVREVNSDRLTADNSAYHLLRRVAGAELKRFKYLQIPVTGFA